MSLILLYSRYVFALKLTNGLSREKSFTIHGCVIIKNLHNANNIFGLFICIDDKKRLIKAMTYENDGVRYYVKNEE